MIYIVKEDGALPILLIKAKNKSDAKEKAYQYYKIIATDVLKKDIFVCKPIDCFKEPVKVRRILIGNGKSGAII